MSLVCYLLLFIFISTTTQQTSWVKLGHDLAAVGADCPFTNHGPSNNLSSCEDACANQLLCNVINYNPSLPDCVFRACTNPLHPELSSTPGYDAYAISKALPPMPSNSSLVKLVAGPRPLSQYQGRNITFFGDSITWLNTYITNLDNAISNSDPTKSLGIHLVNRGINGGTIKDILNGGVVLNTKYPSFKEALAMDNPAVVAIQIGINDVWFPDRNDSSKLPEFKTVLTDLIKLVQGMQKKIYIATVTVIGEKQDGQDPFDAQLDLYAQGQVAVANATGIHVSDLRNAYVAYDMTYNVNNDYSGILTYDGVHPTAYGAMLLADYHALGLLSV